LPLPTSWISSSELDIAFDDEERRGREKGTRKKDARSYDVDLRRETVDRAERERDAVASTER
jgi:hypothetical protein